MADLWKIELLGRLRLQHGSRYVSRFRTQKTGALLAYLASHVGHSQSRDHLCALLWPDHDSSAARNSLSVALSSLRDQLEPAGTPAGSVLIADRFSIGLNAQAITTDVLVFRNLL